MIRSQKKYKKKRNVKKGKAGSILNLRTNSLEWIWCKICPRIEEELCLFGRRSIRWRKIQITFEIKLQFSATLNISVSENEKGGFFVPKMLMPRIFCRKKVIATNKDFTSGEFMGKLELANFVIAKLWSNKKVKVEGKGWVKIKFEFGDNFLTIRQFYFPDL